MTFAQGINFRGSAGYVTDGADEYSQIAPGSGGNYPTTTPQGQTVGWEGTAYLQVASRDRSTSVDRRLAGTNYANTSAVARYRIDLPSSGPYNIRLAAGDSTFASSVQVELFDDTTSLGVLATGAVAAGSFIDATGVTRTAAEWPASNAALTKTFASTICRFGVGTTAASNKVIAHAYIEAASGASGISGTLTSTLGAVTLSAAGTASISGSASIALGALTASASGMANEAGAMSSTLGAMTLAANGTVPVSGLASMTLGALTTAAVGAAGETGALSYTLGALTLSATGAVGNPVVQPPAPSSATLSVQLGAMSLSATGNATVSGRGDIYLSPMTATCTGAVLVAGSSSISLGLLSLQTLGTTPSAGMLSVTLGELLLSARAGMFVFKPSKARTYSVPPENRRYLVAPENRTYRIEP